ncbi:MAG: hypothetical protein WCG47_00210 [Dermatophilaceae bacterium]
MTATTNPSISTTTPPFSRLIQMASGVSLVLAGLLNGLPRCATSQLTENVTFSELIVWGTAHRLTLRAEQILLLVSALFLLPGLLGLAQVPGGAPGASPSSRLP